MSKKNNDENRDLEQYYIPKIDILSAILNAIVAAENELVDFKYNIDENTGVVEINIRCYKRVETNE